MQVVIRLRERLGSIPRRRRITLRSPLLRLPRPKKFLRRLLLRIPAALPGLRLPIGVRLAGIRRSTRGRGTRSRLLRNLPLHLLQRFLRLRQLLIRLLLRVFGFLWVILLIGRRRLPLLLGRLVQRLGSLLRLSGKLRISRLRITLHLLRLLGALGDLVAQLLLLLRIRLRLLLLIPAVLFPLLRLRGFLGQLILPLRQLRRLPRRLRRLLLRRRIIGLVTIRRRRLLKLLRRVCQLLLRVLRMPLRRSLFRSLRILPRLRRRLFLSRVFGI